MARTKYVGVYGVFSHGKLQRFVSYRHQQINLSSYIYHDSQVILKSTIHCFGKNVILTVLYAALVMLSLRWSYHQHVGIIAGK